jgi:hypothetical protein
VIRVVGSCLTHLIETIPPENSNIVVEEDRVPVGNALIVAFADAQNLVTSIPHKEEMSHLDLPVWNDNKVEDTDQHEVQEKSSDESEHVAKLSDNGFAESPSVHNLEPTEQPEIASNRLEAFSNIVREEPFPSIPQIMEPIVTVVILIFCCMFVYL